MKPLPDELLAILEETIVLDRFSVRKIYGGLREGGTSRDRVIEVGKLFERAGIVDPPHKQGGRRRLRVPDRARAIEKLQMYLCTEETR